MRLKVWTLLRVVDLNRSFIAAKLSSLIEHISDFSDINRRIPVCGGHVPPFREIYTVIITSCMGVETPTCGTTCRSVGSNFKMGFALP